MATTISNLSVSTPLPCTHDHRRHDHRRPYSTMAAIPTATAFSVPVATATAADEAPPPPDNATVAVAAAAAGAAAEEPSAAPTLTRGESYQPGGPDLSIIPGAVNSDGE